MMETPKISVVIPVCNVEKYVGECVESVIRQTLKDIEIICVNDGSKDSSPQILEQFAKKDPRVQVVNKPNSGYGNSMNIGFSKATGTYISIVESDDYIAPDMLEKLWALTENGTVDVVKSSFYDFYEIDDKIKADINRERGSMDEVTESFTISEHPEMLWGHPSIWSGIYKRSFLNEHNIHFLEAPGGGWVDNPFFFETLILAKSIKWTKEPYYYYRKTNANSSSNNQTDLTLPLRRMMDNLDVIEKYQVTDLDSLKVVYARALQYYYGVIPEKNYPSQMDEVKRYVRKLYARLNENVFTDNFNIQDQKLYYTGLSPLEDIIKDKQKILIYNWVQFDNPQGFGGGVNIYCRNLIDTILKTRPDVEIYFLSSGLAYDASTTNCYVRGTLNCYWDNCKTFEIVNSPVPAAQVTILNDTAIAIQSEKLKAVLKQFIERNGEFSAIHFNNIEGLSLDCLTLKQDFPQTKFIYSIHNYIPFCAHGFYFNRVTKCNCTPNPSKEDCYRCIQANNSSTVSKELYARSLYNCSEQDRMPEEKWLKAMDFVRLDTLKSTTDLRSYGKKSIEILNENMDLILAVSERVREIAVENGMDPEKTKTSYIGTRVAEYAEQHHPAGLKGKYFKLGYLGSDYTVVEKGCAFLVDALSHLDPAVAGRVDLMLTMTRGDEGEIRAKLKNFHEVTIKMGYHHSELHRMLHDVDLGVIPVLWEDNLPQIAIEMVAMGVPVLCSSRGGASELCSSPAFRFEGGCEKEMLEKITGFVEKPETLSEYWSAAKPLVTTASHWAEMAQYYGIKEPPESVTISYDDFRAIQKENAFLKRHFIVNDDGVQSVLHSWSYRIGSAITYIPRKVDEVYQYCRINGPLDTIARIFLKTHLFLKSKLSH